MTAVGDRAPAFTLPDTEGTMHEPGGAPATVVVFTCNHCPYALAWHERIVGVARTMPTAEYGCWRSIRTMPSAIPATHSEAMRARVESGEFEGVPYLYDDRRTSPAPMARRRRRMCSCSMPPECSATAAPRTPTTTTLYRTPLSCAAPSMRCSTVATPIRSRRHRSVALSSGRPEVAGPKHGVRSARLGQRSRAPWRIFSRVPARRTSLSLDPRYWYSSATIRCL